MGGKVTARAAGFAAGSHPLRLKGAVSLPTLPSPCHFQGQQHEQMTIQAGLLPVAGPSPSQEWPWLPEAPGPGHQGMLLTATSPHTQTSSESLAPLR